MHSFYSGFASLCLIQLLVVHGYTCLKRNGSFDQAPYSRIRQRHRGCWPRLWALSNQFLQDDLVAVRRCPDGTARLCAVTTDGAVVPLCIREDDVETDLLSDPREFSDSFWSIDVTDDNVVESYGEGYYGQRPVPSLGGGPGYGADADEVWSVSEATLESVRDAGVEVPVLDMGIAHGEKARGGSF